jgi:hypothetical protein
MKKTPQYDPKMLGYFVKGLPVKAKLPGAA